MKQTPRAAQAERIERFLAEPTMAALVADDPGYGKTLVAVEAAMQFERVLIIGIKDTFSQFSDSLALQSDGRIKLRRLDSTKAGKVALADMLAGQPGHYFSGSQYLTTQDWAHVPVVDDEGKPVFVVDKKTGLPTDKQESERKHLKTYAKMKPMDLVVFDEIHMIQNRKAIARRTLNTIKTGRKLGMSGTPYGNKFPGIWAVTRWLWPDLIDPNYARWQGDWCTTETVFIGGGKTTTVVTGEKEPGKYVGSLPLYMRSEAEPVPPAQIVWVELTAAQREQYENLERDLVTWLGEHPLVVEIPAVLRQRLRTATLGEMAATAEGEITFDFDTRSSKLRALGGILEHWGAQPAIIGMDSKQFAKVVYARMKAAGESVALWTGDVTSKQRDEVKRAFLAGEVQYIVATITSMSTGLDGFQKVANKLVWLSEMDGDETANTQFVRRLFRTGRTEANGGFQHVRVLARGTKDEGVYGANLQRAISQKVTLRRAA